jgi:23S rRNA (guanine745-N1)-methyltransferase
MWICPVRGCQQELRPEQRRWVCPAQHSFDIARDGYVNLLQPQDRRAKSPGDTREVVAARRRLHERGLTRPLFEGVLALADLRRGNLIAEAGCGEGFYTGTLVAETGARGAGVDISTPAIEAAARRYPNCHWAVANADRILPFPTGSLDLAVSITGRRPLGEFHRVLRCGAGLLVGIPGPQDLIEVRGSGRDRREAVLAELRRGFHCVESRRVTTTAELDAATLADLRMVIYRPAGPLSATSVTLSLDLLLLRRRDDMLEA